MLALVALAPAQPADARRPQVKFGAWTPGAPFNGRLKPIRKLERSIGRRVAVVSWFQEWDPGASQFKYSVAKPLRAIVRSRRKAMMTWEPIRDDNWGAFTNDIVASGLHDGYIRAWARGIARLRRPIHVRLAHEFNGNWYAWGGPVNGNSPESFKRMWTHVVDVARSAGATNVKWVWAPLAEDVPNEGVNHFENYYPGRKYVDVLALDGYNWGGGTPQFGGWRPFRKIFRSAYKRIRKLGPQPVWIAEVGSASDGGSKARWVRNMFRTAQKWKRLKAIVWYNQDKERDWSTASVAGAFRSKRSFRAR